MSKTKKISKSEDEGVSAGVFFSFTAAVVFCLGFGGFAGYQYDHNEFNERKANYAETVRKLEKDNTELRAENRSQSDLVASFANARDAKTPQLNHTKTWTFRSGDEMPDGDDN